MPLDNPSYHEVLEEGVLVKSRSKVNYIGANVIATDNPVQSRVDITVSGGSPFSEILLTPKASSSGAEGTVYYDSDDDHLYVGTE